MSGGAAATVDSRTEELTARIGRARGAARVVLDEHYVLAAYVIEIAGLARWGATAYDELRDIGTGLSQGSTATEAIANVDWQLLRA